MRRDFHQFWINLNQSGGSPVSYDDARAAWLGSDTDDEAVAYLSCSTHDGPALDRSIADIIETVAVTVIILATLATFGFIAYLALT